MRNFQGSSSGSIIPTNVIDENRLVTSASLSLWTLVNFRGARNPSSCVSSAIILSFWERITVCCTSMMDCWFRLIPSVDHTGQFRAMQHKEHTYGIQAVDLEKIKSNLEDIKKFGERVKAFRDDVLPLFAFRRRFQSRRTPAPFRYCRAQ